MDAQAKYVKYKNATNGTTYETAVACALTETEKLQTKAEDQIPLLRNMLERVSGQARILTM